jgi:hypothetical protein
MNALTVITILGAVLLVLGFIFWFAIGAIIFLGAAIMGDVHDDFPTEKDFENRKTK